MVGRGGAQHCRASKHQDVAADGMQARFMIRLGDCEAFICARHEGATSVCGARLLMAFGLTATMRSAVMR
jgi:hypothetical protein